MLTEYVYVAASRGKWTLFIMMLSRRHKRYLFCKKHDAFIFVCVWLYMPPGMQY